MVSKYQIKLEDSSQGSFRKIKDIGLRRGAVSIPAFFIYSSAYGEARLISYQSVDEVYEDFDGITCPIEKLGYQSVFDFFQMSGKRLVVVISPVEDPDCFEDDSFLKVIRGSDKGDFAGRSGFYLLKSLVDKVDLLYFPQFSHLLDVNKIVTISNALVPFLREHDQMFFLIDLPRQTLLSDILSFSKKCKTSNAALFYPWLSDKQGRKKAPGALMAAFMQEVNCCEKIQDSMANVSIKCHWRPITRHRFTKLGEFIKHKVNVIHSFSDKDLRVWGGVTLSEDKDLGKHLICNRRMLMSLKQALESLASDFVFEPFNPDLIRRMRASFDSFLFGLQALRDSVFSRPSFTIDIAKDQDDSGQDSLKVNVSVELTQGLKNISLSVEHHDSSIRTTI